MAGDWIKVEHATPKKPEVMTLAEFLGISRREALGLFVDYCVWLDQNLDESRNGLVTQVSRKSLEETLQCPGFAALLERVKWASFDDEARTMTVINWHRHSGNTAKTRAQAQRRAQRFRNARRNACVTQSALPEKRREDIKNTKKDDGATSAPDSFLLFWSAWPPSKRKVNRRGCLDLWRRDSLDAASGVICQHVETMKASGSWAKNAKGESFEPSPLTYLRQRRWEDGMPQSDEAKRLVI